MNGPGRVALSGGIASGKDEVCRCFTELAVPIIDADQIARTLLAPRGTAYYRVISLFGSRFINSRNRALERPALREIISVDARKRSQLAALLHPLIRKEMTRAYQALATGTSYCIFSIPLLSETGRHEDFDRVLIVDTRRTRQLRRLMARDRCDFRAAGRMLAMQSSRQARLKLADDVIHNDGSLAGLRRQVSILHQDYRQIWGPSATTTGH